MSLEAATPSALRAGASGRFPWRRILGAGVQAGAVSTAMAMIGILAVFNKRPIIVGELTLGYAALGMAYLLAGALIARSSHFPGNWQRLVGAGLTGLTAAAFLALLAGAMLFVDLRSIFVSLDRSLLNILTFGMQPVWSGLLLLLAMGVAAAGGGAVLTMLPARLKTPVAAGLIGAGAAGLFQELIRPILSNNSSTKPVHDLIYTWTGLLPRGAVIVFLASAVAAIVWQSVSRQARERYRLASPTAHRRIRWGYMAAAVAVLLLIPLLSGNFIGQTMLTIALFTLMGMGLNLEVGLAGLLDLGFVAFYAVGAYATALLTADSPFALAQLSYWQAMPIAVLCAVLTGIVFGVPVLKVRGDYLAVATLGLGEIVRVIVASDAAAPLLGGAKGILQIPRPEIGDFQFNTPVSLFYLAFAASALAAYCAWRLEDSRLGRAWKAIRDDEDVAQALGVNLIQSKLLAYGMGAAFAGLAGSIFAVMLGSIYPQSFQLMISINILALIIVGGMGSLPGVAVGAAVLIGLPEVLREFGEFRYLFYGLAIILVMRAMPEGLWPAASKVREAAPASQTPASQIPTAREA